MDIIHIPPSLVLGCNNPVSVNALSDFIEETTGSPLDLMQSGFSEAIVGIYGDGYGEYSGHGNGHGNGNGCGYGISQFPSCGNGIGYGYDGCYSGNGSGCGYGYLAGNGDGNSYDYHDGEEIIFNPRQTRT